MPEDVVASVVLNVIGGLAIIPLTLAGSRLLHWMRSTRPGRSLWCLNERLQTTIVITSGPVADPLELTDIVYPAEARAAAEIEFYLHQIYGDAVIRMSTSSTVSGDQLRANLILIGGPMHNEVTRRALERLRLPLRFEGYDLVSGEERWQARISASNKIETDLGLVVLASNPFYPRGRLVFIAGCRTFGCLAGARALLGEEVVQTLRATGGAPSCVFAVEADVHANEVLSPRVLSSTVHALT
jgi:hypothetical protein